MTDDQQITAQQAIEELTGILNCDTPGEVVARARELAAVTPLVWHDERNGIHVAPLTVRQIVNLIAALEGLTVR